MAHTFSKKQSRVTALAIVEAVKEKPLSSQEISVAIGMTESTVDKYLKTIRAEGLIHIGAWGDLTSGAKNRPRLYLAGDKANAPYPHACRKSEMAGKLGGVATDAELDATPDWAPLRVCPKPPKIQRDWSVSALFGEYQGARV